MRRHTVGPGRRGGERSQLPPVQAKLTVGATNDPLEREADAIADRVMRTPTLDAPLIQRCPGGCPGDEEFRPPLVAQRSPDAPLATTSHEPGHAAASPRASATSYTNPVLESRVRSLRGGGQPLGPIERTFFESRFGYDFARVRIHADGQAAELARAVNARAFTVGQDIVFSSGQYLPHTKQGRGLLAHELTHVVQQRNYSNLNPPSVQRQPNPPIQFRTVGLNRSLGGGTVRLNFYVEDPKNAEPFQFIDLLHVFTGTNEIAEAPIAQPETWVRYDIDVPALTHLHQGAGSVIQPAHWTIWIRFISGGWEAQADPVTRSMIRQVTIAAKRGISTPETISQSLADVVSQHTASCRARYFYNKMSDNRLSPAIIANYGNWCGKGGAGVVMDSLDQCCKEHDECYGREGCSIFDTSCRKECDDCDDIAVVCWLGAVARDPARYGPLDSIRYPCHKCGATLMTPENQQRCMQEC